MTTGEPLVARGAMKPLPTLTKPLRSVDIETKEPAQALRERTDSHRCPRPAWWGRRWWRFVLADAYREKFGGDHIDDVLAALRAYEERIAVASPLTDRALVFVGFMGAGKSDRRPRRGRGLGVEPVDSDACSSASSASRSPTSSTQRRRGGVPRARGGGRRSSCSSRADGSRGRARRRRAAVASACARRCAATLVVQARRRRRRRLAARRGRRAARWPATATRFDAAPRASARRCTSRSPTPSCRRSPRRACRGALPRAARARAAPAGHAAAVGAAALGELPGARRPRPAREPRRLWPAERAALRGDRRRTSAGASPTRLEPLAGRVEIMPGEQSQDAGHAPRSCGRELARAGADARRPRGRARRRRGRRPGRLLRRHLPARGAASCRCPPRSSRRSTRPTAARPASTCPRPRTTSAPTTSRRPCSPTPTTLATLPPEELAAGYAEVVKTALIAGGTLWERVRAGAAVPTTATSIARLRAHEAARRRRRTSATAAAARCSTSATPSATRSRPPPATRATATARRSALGLLAALRLSGRTSCATRWPSCSRRAGLPDELDGRDRRRRPRGHCARQEAPRRGRGAVRAARRARRRAPGRAVADRRARAPPCESWRRAMSARNRVEVMHGVNLDHARPPRPRRTTAA